MTGSGEDPAAETVLVAGTASHVGKSTIVAGLCRLLSDRGVDVAPYKAQNMSNNARVALAPSGEWGEIGVSQHVQARAARIPATTDMNPVLLKPRGDGESQLILQGEAVGHYEAGSYYEAHWDRAREAAVESYERLAADHEVIVAEGAGSIAEINLHDRDLANLETAAFADARVVLAVDIERGGAFASLYGTLELLPAAVRGRVVGAVITKFRGDRSLLEPGIEEVESRTGVPILGVVPHDDPGLPAEDSVSLPDSAGQLWGDDDSADDEQAVTIGVPRLPRISNFTDLEPLAHEPGVRVQFVPPDGSLAGVDAVVLPGSKNTVDDLLALRHGGLAAEIRAFNGPVVGLCGGYQMLGERIHNADIESTAEVETVAGLGLLPVETVFSREKRVERVRVQLDGKGPLAGAAGPVEGYEIHMGDARFTDEIAHPVEQESAATEQVLGTYLHGLFENDAVRAAFLNQVFETAGPPRRERTDDHDPYAAAAALIGENVDLEALGLE